ncbi:SMALL AUXIN UPREGULATED RNA 38 [Hibiscus trionum]|uniref:SMALL AUXIN UPREGULATED RNA 38 n=1 Tax=Hibiscus trionum TaxID=183268 RepID=A0A9W7GTI7_HIBTR|nr:SMALL AUXIN UPREGULATED RNA 38 [Hibiscus trionum]
MDSKKSNKISEIVRLQQILKKWKKLANASKKTTTSSGGSKSMKFLKRTLSFNDVSAGGGGGEVVPKGFVAVCVGKELKRYTIPMEYLGHEAFEMLLRQAEEEFGFQQEGVLKIPCEVSMFDNILNTLRIKKEALSTCYSPDSDFTTSHHPQMCR